MDYETGHVMNLANSIIGVSVLAMPYCFKQCGIVLSILMLLISSVISRLACHFLLKSAIIARRKTFEFLAFYIFGAMGKFAIEISIIGFLIGTCIAFFVVMGDLGPEIIAEVTGSYTTNTMRSSILMALALFCVLPLGLLRNVDSLNGVSKATIGFYCCLVLKIVFEGIPHIFSGDWYNSVNLWRPAGILQCLPIFTMALFCQTQLFEIYQALQNATLEEMNNLVRVAVNICTCVYIFVGVFGYIAFFQKPFTGNILLSFPPSLMTDVIKIGFILSVAFSFPLIIFPCRASLYSLLYKEGYPLHEGMSTYIPEGRFKGLTLFIVFISLIIGIMIPNIELVLGLVGSTIGVMICVIFPVTCFICISPKNTNERILAQFMLMVGVFVMVLGTYKNLYTLDKLETNTVTINSLKNMDQLDLNVGKALDKIEMEKNVENIVTTVKALSIKDIPIVKVTTAKVEQAEELKEVRHEPPQPVEPVEEVEVEKAPNKEGPALKNEIEKIKAEEKDPPVKLLEKPMNDSRNDEVDIEAIKKEEKEVEQQEQEKKNVENDQALIDTLQKQNEVQKEFVEQQKKINEEKVKAMKHIENIAKEAIEKISGGKNDEKIVADLEKHIQENVNLNVEQNINEKNEVNAENNVDPVKEIPINVIENSQNEGNIKIVSNKEGEPLLVGPDSLSVNDKNDKTINDKNEKIIVEKVTKDEPVKKENSPKINISPENTNNIERGQDTIHLENQLEVIKNNSTGNIVQPNETKPEKENVKVNASSQFNVTNLKNTAPLFLKLGKPETKSEENNVKKMVPIPLIMSGNVMNNLSKSESSSNVPKELKKVEEVPLAANDDVQAIRRDILSVKNER